MRVGEKYQKFFPISVNKSRSFDPDDNTDNQYSESIILNSRRDTIPILENTTKWDICQTRLLLKSFLEIKSLVRFEEERIQNLNHELEQRVSERTLELLTKNSELQITPNLK